MAEPCAVFWDVQNVNVPKGKSVDFIVDLVRSAIIKSYNLDEIFFFCVCDFRKLSSNIGHSLTNLDFLAYDGFEDSADNKIIDLMRKFVKFAGQDCTIILLSGDGDYYGTLRDLKKLHNVSIHLIGLANSFSSKLIQIADNSFILNNGLLKPVKSTGSPSYFISILNQYSAVNFNELANELNALAIGSIENSAILCDNLICIGFPTMWNAEQAIKQLHGSGFRGRFLKAGLIVNSTLNEILKFIKPNVDIQTKSNNEVKQLTLIKMSNSYGAGISKIIKFCIACNVQSGSQCILSSESFLWIVFLYESDAQNFLPKVQIMYPDAVISGLPIDLLSKCPKNPYTVESCEEMVANRVPSSVASLDVRDDTDWNIFFRYNPDFTVPVLNYEPTKWSLLYNLFEKLYDLKAKKVIFDGNFYCAHFDSASSYRDAFERIRSHYLEPLEFVPSSEIHNKQGFKEKMNQYKHDIPWCLNEQLDLSCILLRIDPRLHDHFMEISKNILGNRECIFIKSTQGRICIGFPDGIIRSKSKKIREFLESFKQSNESSIAKPSNELLKSISFRDLAGDAYDLAFLSSQLEDAKPMKRPQIIERIRMDRMREQECNELLFHFTVYGKFYNRWDEKTILAVEQTVKILVNLTKVIPLAAKGWYDGGIHLIYKSWYEAHAAQHFINRLPSDEIPYFRKFDGTSLVQQSAYSKISDREYISEYYIINDNRKVLEKIVQNKRLVDKLDSNLFTAQSTTDVLDEEMKMKLQYIFAITVNSEFKFTSGMISMIKVNLVQMDCLACIEFEDKIWVAFDNLEKGNKAKANINNKIKFILLHENDEDDFEVGVVMESIQESPPKVTKMLANKLMDPKTSSSNIHWKSDPFPLGHFNYSYRKAVGMSTSRYYSLINA